MIAELQSLREPVYSPYGDWRVYRDSYRGYDDEYHATDSWTAMRTLRGQETGEFARGEIWSRVPRRIDITLRLHIRGERKNGRLRPVSWWASVQVGAGYETPFFASLGIGEARGTCTTLADATRQADASDELAARIRDVVRSTYTQRENQAAVFRVTSKIPQIWNDPWPEGPPTIEPWAVVFRPVFGSFDGDLPDGQFVSFSWRRVFLNKDRTPVTSVSGYEWRKSVTLYRIHGWGGSSSCSPEEHTRFEPLFPEWFTPPTSNP